jgi:hypothetical protein
MVVELNSRGNARAMAGCGGVFDTTATCCSCKAGASQTQPQPPVYLLVQGRGFADSAPANGPIPKFLVQTITAHFVVQGTHTDAE